MGLLLTEERQAILGLCLSDLNSLPNDLDMIALREASAGCMLGLS